MAVQGAVVSNTVDITRGHKSLKVKYTLSGNYPTGGEILDMTAITKGNGVGEYVRGIPTEVESVTAPDGYAVEFKAAAVPTMTNIGKLRVTTASDTELGAGAYPANLSGDTDGIVLLFKGLKTKV